MVKRYVRLAETLDLSESTTSDLLHDDYLQWELPNQLNKTGQKSDRADSYRRMEIAKKLLAEQKYEMTSLTEEGPRVVMEAEWSGTLAIDAGALKAGQVMKAFFCMIFEFKDGKIHRVRNYDCFST